MLGTKLLLPSSESDNQTAVEKDPFLLAKFPAGDVMCSPQKELRRRFLPVDLPGEPLISQIS